MNSAEIKYKLALVKKSQADVAAIANVTPQSVYKVINGILHSQKIAESLSVVTGIPVEKLFPDNGYSQAA